MSAAAMSRAVVSLRRQRTEYQRRGYTVFRGVFGRAAMARIARECDRLRAVLLEGSSVGADGAVNGAGGAPDPRLVPRRTLDGGYKADRIDPVSNLSPAIAELTRHPELTRIGAAMMGEDVLLMKDKLIFKNPGVHGYEVHQDYHYWQEMPPPPECMLSILVAIDAAGARNGAVAFYPGMHARKLTSEGEPTDLFTSGSGVVPEKHLEGKQAEVVDLEPGDTVVFSSLAPHWSGPNRTATPRRAFFITYSAARFGDLYAAYYDKFNSYREQDARSATVAAH